MKISFIGGRLFLIIVLAISLLLYMGSNEAIAHSSVVKTSPSNGLNVSGSTLTFQWSGTGTPDPGDSFSKYAIVIGNGADTYDAYGNRIYTNTIYYGFVGSATSITVSGFLNNGTTYYWYVDACDTYNGCWNGDTEWSFINGNPSTPSLTSPADNDTVLGSNVTFSWSSVTNATKYHIKVFDQYGALFDEDQSVTTTSRTFANFGNNESDYTWQVRAGHSTGWSSFSAVRHFTNSYSYPPTKPYLSYPSNGDMQNNSGTMVYFAWKPASRATEYLLEVFDDSGALFESKSFTDGSTSTNLSGFLDNGSIYTWLVTAQNAAGSTESDTWSFANYASAKPDKPLLSYPSNNDMLNNSGGIVFFAWNATARVKEYYLEVFDDTGALFDSVTITDGSTGTAVPNFGDDGRIYTWRVTAQNNLGSTESDTWRFENFPSMKPDTPVLLWPVDNYNEAGSTISFAWEDTFGAKQYDIEVYDDSGTLFYSATITDGSTGIDVPNFRDDGTTYYWQVIAMNDAGSSVSDTSSFVNGVAVCTPSVSTGTGVLGQTRTLNTCMMNPQEYYLIDSSHSPTFIITEDENATSSSSTGKIMKNDSSLWGEDVCQHADGLAGQCAGVDAHYFAGLVYEYLLNKFQLGSYDGNFSPMNTVINSELSQTNNAAWDGVAVYIGLSENVNGTMILPYSGSLSMIGHEWGHAVTESASGLSWDPDYGYYEACILNEAFSDWLGITIERSYGGASWTLLEGIYPGRNLANPSLSRTSLGSQPDTYLGARWGDLKNCSPIKEINGFNDGCYAHFNTGVPNKMFYLLSVGTQAGNGGPFNDVTVQPIGIDKAMDIAYKANKEFWRYDNTFNDGLNGMVQAARRHHGENEANQVQNAWAAVGVGTRPLITTSVSSGPLVGGTSTGGGEYEWGATATVSATPYQDFTFLNWTEDGTTVSTSASYQFTVNGGRTLVANFAYKDPTLNAPYVLPDFGNYYIGESQTESITVTNYGLPALNIQSAYITGDSDFTITPANDGCSGKSLTYNQTCKIKVTFTPTGIGTRSATLNILSNDPNGPVSMSLSGVGTSQITITATAGSGGSITPAVAYVLNHGTQKFSITPNVGYQIVDVKVDNVSKGTIAEYTFADVIGDHSITASFAKTTYKITAKALSGGTITPSGTITFNYNSSQTYIFQPSAGYHIKDVLVDNQSMGDIQSYTFSDITADHTIQVSFANTYTLAVGKTGMQEGVVTSDNGGINCGETCSAEYAPGSSVTLTAQSDSAVPFKVWSGACSGNSLTCTVTMNEDTTVYAQFGNVVVGWLKKYEEFYTIAEAKLITPTSDGGYVMANKSQFYYGGAIHKLNANGEIDWTFSEKLEHVNSHVEPTTIQQTSDGGYIVAGEHISVNVSGDYNGLWIMKLRMNGAVMWNKVIQTQAKNGGRARSIQQTSDGGYIVAGYLSGDSWVLKLSKNGDVEWEKEYVRANKRNYAYSIQQTHDGGYIVAGMTGSSGRWDIWVLKLLSDGNIEWQKSYGTPYSSDETYNSWANSIQQTTDGGYIVASLRSIYNKVTNVSSLGGVILKLQLDGTVSWQKEYSNTVLNSIQQTPDGYVVAGTQGAKFYYDAGARAWVSKLDLSGNIIWGNGYTTDAISSTVKYTPTTSANSIRQTSDGGYVVGGISRVTNQNSTHADYAMAIKMDANGDIGGTCSLVEPRSVTVTDANLTSTDTNASWITENVSVVPGYYSSSPWDRPSYTSTTTGCSASTSATVPTIGVSPASLGFGSVSIGSQKSMTATITNTTGNMPLAIEAVTISGMSSTEFVQTNNCSSVSQGGSCTITMTFTPAVLGNKSATLKIMSNDPQAPIVEVPLSGTCSCNLQIYKDGTGSGTVSSDTASIVCGNDCTESYSQVTSVTLTAVSELGSVFAGWSGGGCSETTTCIVTMNSDVEVTAMFNMLPPVADFSCSPTSGSVPFTFTCTDLSTNTPDSWEWDFDDGHKSDLQNPESHMYTSVRSYSISLKACNLGGCNTTTKADYITAEPCTNRPVQLLNASGAVLGYYSTLTEAYSAAADGNILRAQTLDFYENIAATDAKSVRIDGGYDCTYSLATVMTSVKPVNGTVHIQAGAVTIGNVHIVDVLDADGDGMPDTWEAAFGVTDPALDADGDGLRNLEEFQQGTNPRMQDTDNDGFTDKQEVDKHKDPLDPASKPTLLKTLGNNITILDANGFVMGGSNDVTFEWNGTKKTTVATSGQVSNATLSSLCLFWGYNWSAHDVAIYGPGTYTVYTDCAAGSPGCGTGLPITFTVGTGEIGVHMLFDWGSNKNMDVVNVWQPNAVFGPSPLLTGGCGTNPVGTVWDWMSKDWNGDGINGAPIIDGGFAGVKVNFNVMGVISLGNNFTLLLSNGYIAGGTNDVKFTWNGTLQDAATFANGNGPSNATITSDEPLYGWLWYARNVHVVGPGTYWVDLDGAGTSTNRYEVTIPTGQIGVHLLLDWGETGQATSCGKIDCDVDVWMAWDLNYAFAVGKLYTGADDGTSTNAPASDDPPVNSSQDGRPNVSTKVWDLVSVDLAGRVANSSGITITNLPLDGVPGIKLREGSFYLSNINFNLMMEDLCADVSTRCNDNNACTADSCNPLTGACVNTTITCDDSNLCTTDSCNTMTGCVNTPKDCNDNKVCTNDYCNMSGTCVHVALICNDNNICTTDSCSQAAGGCVFTNNTVACTDNNGCTVNDTCAGGFCIPGTAKVCPSGVCSATTGCPVSNANTSGNNMTMIIPTGLVIGGTNDVKFTWDGTVQDAAIFANGTGPSNATIRSDEPLSSWLWYARNVQVVGPGTYWVDLDGAGPSLYRYEVTIPAGRIGAHMLLDWGETGHATSCGKSNCDVDVWVAWDYNNALMTGKLFTGADDGTNTTAPAWDDPPVSSVTDGSPNASNTVWNLVSVDFAGRVITPSGALIRNLPLDNVPGMRVQEGAYNGTSFSFNVKVQ